MAHYNINILLLFVVHYPDKMSIKPQKKTVYIFMSTYGVRFGYRLLVLCCSRYAVIIGHHELLVLNVYISALTPLYLGGADIGEGNGTYVTIIRTPSKSRCPKFEDRKTSPVKR